MPEKASETLPSRGQVMVEGTINGIRFRTPLEPDGRWGHWFRPGAGLLKATGLTVGDTATLAIAPTKNWPEPDVPADLRKVITSDPQVQALWKDITPLARWEWIRWTRATNKAEIRKRRLEVALSKLRAGERRPCCWNRNLCTEPQVSKNGMLLDPDPVA